MENKEKLISDFEAAACNNEQESIEDPIKFYSENGLISCMEKTDDQKLLVLGTENLSMLNIYTFKKLKNKILFLFIFNKTYKK